MTQHYADATDPRLSSPLLFWLLPSAAMIAAVVGLAFIAATFGLSRSPGGDAVTAPGMPSIGSITSASLANGDRPFAFLEFDWDPTTGVPGFGAMPRADLKHDLRAAAASPRN
jgi:hypothetical protein